MNGKLRIPFREINVNTLPIPSRPPPANKSAVIVERPVDTPIKNSGIKPHIIFLGNASNKHSSATSVSVGRRQNVADPDLIRTRKIINGVTESPFLDVVNTHTKLRSHVSTTSAINDKDGKGTEKQSAHAHSNDVAISIIDKNLTPVSAGGSSQSKPVCYEDCLSDSSLSDDFEQRPKKVKKCPTRKKSEVCNATQPDHALSSASEISEVMKILPEGYDYNIQMEDIPPASKMSSKCKNFIAIVKVDIFSAERVQMWKTEFEKSSFSDYRVIKTDFGHVEDSKRVIFKKKYRCHHNTMAEKSGSKVPHEKHTQCPAQLTITVRNSNMKWSSDDLLKTHPSVIKIKYMHNHYIDPLAGDILRHRRPAPEVVEKFTNLFSNTRVYHSPSSAMDVYLADLELVDSLCLQVGDGATVPTMAWVQKLFKKLTTNKCGDQYGPGMLEALEKYVDEYNTECGDICAKVGVTDDGENHFVSICSPMMKRIHTHHKASGEVMFIDSSGSMDNNNARVFVILTPSVACGLPIGLLITFSESEKVITAALQKWIEILPKHAFYGRGPTQGPKIILSDDHTGSRNSLRFCFPEAILLLCIFHVLQAMWRYVWDSDHGVKFEHRAEIYFLFRQILYATSEEEFNALYVEALNNAVLLSYKIVYDHIKGLKDRGSEWALCFRQHLLTRGNHTNNYCEAAMRILKDKIFDRVRAFNTVQLMDFLVTRIDAYYSRKLAFLVNNRVEGFSRTRYRIKPEKLAPLIASKLSDYEHLYQVVNTEKNTEYVVDADLEVCSCPVGLCGAPCKHQCIVAKTFKLSHHQFLPLSDSTIKAIFYYIMSGNTEVPAGLFKMLKGGDSEDVININNIPEFQLRDSNDCGDQPDFEQLSMEEIVHDSAADSSTSENISTIELPKKTSLVEMAMDLAQRCSNSPECISEPVDKFLKTYWSIVHSKNHESTLASALATFGKDFSALKPINHRPKARNHRGSKQERIPVQPTAPPRRKVFTGGKKTLVGGRPLQTAYQAAADHGYSQVKRKPARTYGESWCQPPAKKSKVPHSMAKCVDANVRLPK